MSTMNLKMKKNIFKGDAPVPETLAEDKPTAASCRLDAADLRILDAVRRHGRMSKQALAEAVGLSPTPAWVRLRRLEAAGIIAGYHARITLETTRPKVRVLLEVTLASHRYADFQRFERAVEGLEEVVECHAVGGGVDYFLTIETADIDSYQRFVDRILSMEIGVQRYFTYIVTRQVKVRPD